MPEVGVPRTQDTAGTLQQVDAYSLTDGKVQEAVVVGDGVNNGRIVGVSKGGGFQVRQYDDNTLRSPKVNTFGAFIHGQMLGLVNSTFYTATAVTDNYTTANTGSATITSNTTDGFATLASGTTNPSTAQMTSKDFATYNGIGPLLFLNGLRAPQAGVAGCIRRWGAYDTNNGYFFEDNAGTFRVVSRKAGVDTAVTSGSFNGLIATTYVLDQNSHFFEIEITGGRAVFMIDQVALHIMAVPAGATTSSATLVLPIRVEVISTQTVNMTLEARGQNIARLGAIDSARLNEALLDVRDAEVVRAVMAGTSGANVFTNAYVSPAGVQRVDLAAGTNLIGYVNPDVLVATAALSALNAAVSVPLNGHGTVEIEMSGTFTATLSFEGLSADGTTWRAMTANVNGNSSQFSTSVAAWAKVGVSGFRQFRVRVSSYTSGTANVSLNASYAPHALPVPDVLQDGNTFADSRNSIQVLGRTAGTGSGAVSKVLIVDANGNLVMGAGTNLVGQVRAQTAATPTVTGVAGSATSVAVLAANANRVGASFQNDATSGTLYLREGATAATAASGGHTIAIVSGGYFEVPPGVTSAYQGIWSVAGGFVNVTERVT